MHMLNIRLVSRMYYKSISKNFTHQKWVKFWTGISQKWISKRPINI
jgi:hypothetical protein